MSTVNVPRAAELLCVHANTVLKLIEAGALPAAKIGRAYVLLERDVLQYAEDEIIRQTSARMGLPLLTRRKVSRPKL
jgi:excisionase family DNA binding protein